MNNIKLLDKIDDVLVYDSGTVICDNICDIVFSDVKVARNYAFKFPKKYVRIPYSSVERIYYEWTSYDVN